MIEEVLSNLFRIEIPLPHNPLKSINSYVIKGPEGNLIVDTGMNRDECSRVMFSSLKELDIDLNKTDIFITHYHADHLGLVGVLATDESKVYLSQPEVELISFNAFWEETLKSARVHGFPVKEFQAVLDKHPGNRYAFSGPVKFNIVRDGDVIKIGGYSFKCVETPGHTKGHMCLYEPGKKILISGDHILGDITPNISLFTQKEGNPLKEFLESLDKVYNFDVEIVLPGHRNIFKNIRGRIDELKHHHQERSEQILTILEKGRTDAYTVASQMSWEIDSPTWEQFPVPQRWFATGEAIAHLKQLEEEGKVIRLIENTVNMFSLCGPAIS